MRIPYWAVFAAILLLVFILFWGVPWLVGAVTEAP